MTVLPRLACIALLLSAAVSAPSRAESIASSASSAGSASLGSLSESSNRSSDSSRRDRQARDGDYRVIDVAALPERAQWLRLRLQPVASADGADDEVWVELPRQALAQRGLARGDVVRARGRPYGLEFAHADTREPFFLALAADWRRELEPRLVTR
jgi:hypothetical protein